MARPLKLYPATLPLTPEEQAARQAFIDAYTSDYGPFSASDEHMLHLASIEYVKSIRLQVHELSTGNILTAARQHPINQLVKLLDSMIATRASKMRQVKQPTSDNENTMKDFLMSISEIPTRSNGHVKQESH